MGTNYLRRDIWQRKPLYDLRLENRASLKISYKRYAIRTGNESAPIDDVIIQNFLRMGYINSVSFEHRESTRIINFWNQIFRPKICRSVYAPAAERKVPRHDRPVEQKKALNSNLMGFFAEDVWEMQSFSPKRLTGEPGQTIK
ncbi:uncharacterized protein PADG_11859 [Paracoccidioides brasiliensis Pb18]|uniref:Uncharacterized protein n=1 Tax=Paracoccidioides brasiliensis (strain Pb18) TaxID=502780 RepID=A0A0A0HXC7_PARBD|nr:uncharacterized protein PADG_11859 [Paracoccidioides brasiliensis Pb18]KGM92065.1 hypothetical protein PADG_11859 [Paracoccidioides brasiliensis Pb18]